MDRRAVAFALQATSPAEYESALGRMQAALAVEIARREKLERELRTVRAVLARARASLKGTQAGEQRALHLALHDGLTALPNRRFFSQRLAEAVAGVSAEHPTLAVIFLDLDGFKPINDLHGHNAGDEVLGIVGSRLARAVRAEDMMSRLGGDEFACLVGDCRSADQLGHLAAKLFETVAAPLSLGGLTLHVRPSIGIAMYPADGTTSTALLRSADAAMYRAKQQQTGYAFCDRRPGTDAGREPSAQASQLAAVRECADVPVN